MNMVTDLNQQVVCHNKATGATQEAYKKVILDKSWAISRKVGEFYHSQLAGLGRVETSLLNINSAKREEALSVEEVLRDFQMERANQTSDTSAVLSVSGP